MLIEANPLRKEFDMNDFLDAWYAFAQTYYIWFLIPNLIGVVYALYMIAADVRGEIRTNRWLKCETELDKLIYLERYAKK